MNLRRVKNRRGFTVVEVIIAILILTVGILGLASTAALVTRMIGQGYRYTEASALAAERFEILRSRPCIRMTPDSAVSGLYGLRWAVDTVPGLPPGRRLRLIVTHPIVTPGAAARVDSFQTAVSCEI